MRNNFSWLKLIQDIRFWIIVFFVIRIYGITDAPLESSHNWRQSLTAMIARNFYEDGLALFYPRIDMAGEKTGIIGSEFPLFNALIYGFSKLFGYAHWYGRLINLIVCSIGTYHFYRLVKALFNGKVALYAGILLLTSIWFSFSRKIMPDTFSVALVLIGFNYLYQYLGKGKLSHLLLYFLLITAGMLSKIPSLSLLAVWVAIPFIGSIPKKLKIQALLTTIASIMIVFSWYFYWVPHLLLTYQYALYFPKTLTEGINEIIPLWKEYLEKFYFSSFHSYVAFIAFLVGSFLFLSSKSYAKILGAIAVFTVFIAFTIKTGSVFALHSYYIIPVVPLMAILAAFGLSKIHYKYVTVILILIAAESIANQQHDFYIKPSQTYKLSLENILDQNLPTDSRIVINGGDSPQDIYFANRNGWTITSSKLLKPTVLDSLIDLGAEFMVLDLHREYFKLENQSEVYTDENYKIYKLSK